MEGTTLSISMKRNWFAREAIGEVLQSLGLPSTMDGTHVVFRGMDDVAEWILLMSEDSLAQAIGYSGDRFNTALKEFSGSAGPLTVRQLMAPGVSFGPGGGRIDGVAMKIGLVHRAVDDGPDAYIIPVERRMLMNGAEWNETVALVPKTHIDRWLGIVHAADEARRKVQWTAGVLRVFNGADQVIQPLSLDDIIMDDSVKTGFVQDILGFLARREWYQGRRIPWTRRYILNGPAGTGKTSLARWAATGLGLPAYGFDFSDRYATGGDFVRFLSYAQRSSPAVILLDDFEKVFKGDGNNLTGVTPHTILTSFSGVGSMDGLIVIATSNSREPFAGPMRRRFDAIIEVGLPSPELRMAYFEKVLQQDPEALAAAAAIAGKRTERWSFDDLRAVVTAAANSMAVNGRTSIEAQDLEAGWRAVQQNRAEQASGN